MELPIKLPHGETNLNRNYLRVNYRLNDNLIADCFDKVDLKKGGSDTSPYHYFVMTDLQVGSYDIRFLNGTQWIQFKVTVLRGEKWHDENFILQKNSITETCAKNRLMKFEDIKVEKSKNQNKITVKVKDVGQGVHLHALAHHFIPTNNQVELCKIIEKFNKPSFSSKHFGLEKWHNIFSSNQQMKDEIRYVYDRKQLQAQLGNTLERPTLLAKKSYVRETEQEARGIEDRSALASTAFSKQMAPGGRAGRERCADGASGHSDKCTHSEMANFLKTAPMQKLNLQPSEVTEDGVATFTFTADLADFSQLYLVAADRDSSAQHSLDLNCTNLQMRDLRLTQLPSLERGLTQTRVTLPLAKGASNLIEDITSTDVTLVDSLPKVREILKELCKIQGASSCGLEPFFDMCMRWHSFSREEKDTKWSDHMCHELHFFLYQKDREYFDDVVAPFLQCKMEK